MAQLPRILMLGRLPDRGRAVVRFRREYGRRRSSPLGACGLRPFMS